MNALKAIEKNLISLTERISEDKSKDMAKYENLQKFESFHTKSSKLISGKVKPSDIKNDSMRNMKQCMWENNDQLQKEQQ